MKKIFALLLLFGVVACASDPDPKEAYPYNMSEQEWNQLSIKDKARIRRDFYFYEKGQVNFVNPDMDIEGKKELPNIHERKMQAPKKMVPAPMLEE